ncbi:MAG: adenine phosphoribosyltransferase [Cellulomonadaceae bacterium]|jgi:adenine phosphoribosyltransferase|nr:adenine phosphoribosyltransferase [Cellulomonadaceae bacterium]
MADDIALTGLTVLGEKRAAELRALIRDIPGYPHEPIIFRDITPMLADGAAFNDMVEAFARLYEDEDGHHGIDCVVGMEARGFILGAALALRLGVGFVPLRKAGKLPPPVESQTYDLEYGTATLEVRSGTFSEGDSVLVIDDILATGGTAQAAAKLVESAGGTVRAMVFLMELGGLPGRARLSDRQVDTLLFVDEEQGFGDDIAPPESLHARQ